MLWRGGDVPVKPSGFWLQGVGWSLSIVSLAGVKHGSGVKNEGNAAYLALLDSTEAVVDGEGQAVYEQAQ